MTLQEIRDQITALRTQAQQQARELFDAGVKEVFVEWPELESFSWTQYTPYFNDDGDTCTFIAHTEYITIQLATENGEEVEIKELGHWDLKNDCQYHPELRPYQVQATKLMDWLNQFNDEELLALFGDHVRVTVTKDGAETEEYDHD